MRARLALAASGRRCELREVVLRDKPQALIQASPKATVPVLVLPDGTVLEQSLDIMLWALREHDPQGWLAPQGGDLPSMLALIRECDEKFKRHLDRYKYPGRFMDEFAREGGAMGAAGGDAGGARQAAEAFAEQANAGLSGWAHGQRDAGGQWLRMLEARLQRNAYLFGPQASLADMAIAPFVRQYAHVDRQWFDAQPWPRLQAWLRVWMESDLFARIMAKYRPWTPEAPAERFP